MRTTPPNPIDRPIRMRRFFLPSLIVFLVLATVLPDLAGQTPPQRPIGSIEIGFIELENVNRDLVRANMRLREGMEYDEMAIDRDIRALYRTGLFEYIEVRREFLDDGSVNLFFELRPKYRVESIEFRGNENISDRRLIREVGYDRRQRREGWVSDVLPWTPRLSAMETLDERTVRIGADDMRDFYRRRGYTEATVTYEIERDRETGTGRITYFIEEGPRVTIRRVEFEGNDNVRSGLLRRSMETRRWHIFSWLTGKGRFREDQFEDDIDTLIDRYRERGFLDVRIPHDSIRFEYPYDDQLQITLVIEEGRQYEVGEITFVGNTLFSDDDLRGSLVLGTGSVFVPSRLDEDVQNLRDHYGQDGYLDTLIQARRIPNLETGAIDVEYRIQEAGQVFVESIRIDGNTKTQSRVIIRELGLRPGDVFNSVRMRTSQRRLENTRFFEHVNLSPESTGVEGRRNLGVSVREARTGSLTFGAGFSTLENVIFFAELSQSNFDLFNYRSRFQGAGQKFRFRLQVGSRSNEVVLAFEEPWLFDRELALGFQVYRSESEYFSAAFDELRTGFEVYLRKRLIELLEGRLAYRFEVVDIFNISSGASQFIREERGRRSVSKVGLTLLRDTRDSLLVPTRGNRVEFLTEVAGGPFAGDTDYYKFELRGSQFIPVFEPQTQVLSFVARTGVIDSFRPSDRVPFFDRFFLGGPNTLRGFNFREVGPHTDGDPMGGGTYGFFSTEYSLTLVDPIRFAVFYDAGFVNSDFADFSTGGYNDNYGFGLRILIMGAPLRLDYGIPITTDDHNDRGGRFSFSFGTRF